MPPRPDALYVLGQRYRIDYSTDPQELLIWGEEDGPENKVGAEMLGKSNHATQEIVARAYPAVGFDAERDTVLHEALHAIFALTDLDSAMSDKMQEQIVTRMATGLLDLIRMNREFIRYLQTIEQE